MTKGRRVPLSGGERRSRAQEMAGLVGFAGRAIFRLPTPGGSISKLLGIQSEILISVRAIMGCRPLKHSWELVADCIQALFRSLGEIKFRGDRKPLEPTNPFLEKVKKALLVKNRYAVRRLVTHLAQKREVTNGVVGHFGALVI